MRAGSEKIIAFIHHSKLHEQMGHYSAIDGEQREGECVYENPADEVRNRGQGLDHFAVPSRLDLG
ncbi:hypothetical protein D3C81_2057640 [compost metagenome]